MKVELKENQAALIIEYREDDGAVLADIQYCGDDDSVASLFCQFISDKLEKDASFWDELIKSVKEEINRQNYETAHKHSIFHRAEIMKSKVCGCFSCMEIFPPDEIEIWTDTNKEHDEHTAVCSHCLTDAVIGDASGYPIINSFLVGMCQRWFGDAVVRIYEERLKAFYGK